VTWSIKRNDRAPSFTAQLIENGSPMTGLAGATAKFIMKEDGAAEADDPKVDAEATITDEDLAMVQYDWADGDTDTVGLYRAEFEITYSNGLTRTVPTRDYLYVRVLADLG
jgi:hypothetical protein